MKTRIIGAILAIILAIGAGVAIWFYVRSADQRAAEGAEFVPVLVATQEIPTGTPAAAVGDLVELTELPALAVADGAVTDLSEIEGLVANGAVLVDALHYQKCGSTLAEVQDLPASMLNYLQLCDGPGTFARDGASLLHAARHDRLMPGDGDIDLVGLVRAMPDEFVFGVEVPNDRLLAQLGLEEFLATACRAARKVLVLAGR